MSKKRILTIIEIVCVIIFIVSLTALIIIGIGYVKGNKIYNAPRDTYSAEPFSNIPKKYREYLDTNIDMASLVAENPAVVGWIYIKDTGVNYPLVAASNSPMPDTNDFYLTHTFDNQQSKFGAIFIDCSCSSDLTDINTIIHGHNTKDGSMFGTLRKFREEEFYNSHPYVFIFLPNGNVNVYKVVLAKTTEAASDLYFDDSSMGTRITLSTCTQHGKKRYVVIAELVDQFKGKE